MLDTKRLIDLAAQYGVTVTPAQADACDTYAQLLVLWNKKMNLTAITDPEGMLVKHFVDCFTLAPHLPADAFSMIDVGTGAGFPGIPIAILRPDCALTLLDSLNKRLIFLEDVCRTLGISAVRVHARAEDGGHREELREQFDIATARAVASLPTLCEYCLPFVKTGGQFLALKGPDADAELTSAKRALAVLHGEVTAVHALTLPAVNGEISERRLVCIRKRATVPDKYPRSAAKIAKQPW